MLLVQWLVVGVLLSILTVMRSNHSAFFYFCHGEVRSGGTVSPHLKTMRLTATTETVL